VNMVRTFATSEMRHLICCMFLVSVALLSNFRVLEQALLGLDTYPQIVASRVISFPDFIESFTRPLTDGLIDAAFYRPVQNLSLALDYSIWKLDPFGYQLTSLVVYLVTTVLVYMTSLRILGRQAFIGVITATAFWALHPVLLNVLPFPCRRSELLVTGFLCLALMSLPTTPERASLRKTITAGVFVLLATGAKETGAMGIGLIFVYRTLIGSHDEKRLRAALRDCAPAILGVTLLLAARISILGDMGGYPLADDSLRGFMWREMSFGVRLMEDLFYPGEFLPGFLQFHPEQRALLAALLALLLVLAGFWVILTAWRGQPMHFSPPALMVCIGLAWSVPPVLTLGLMKFSAPWYPAVPLAGLAFVIGGTAQAATGLIKSVDRQARTRGVMIAAVTMTILLFGLRYTPTGADYREWDIASSSLAKTLHEFDRILSTASPGDIIYVRRVLFPPMPKKSAGVNLRWVSAISEKGVGAWAQMSYPQFQYRTEWRSVRDSKQKLTVLHIEP